MEILTEINQTCTYCENKAKYIHIQQSFLYFHSAFLCEKHAKEEANREKMRRTELP